MGHVQWSVAAHPVDLLEWRNGWHGKTFVMPVSSAVPRYLPEPISPKALTLCGPIGCGEWMQRGRLSRYIFGSTSCRDQLSVRLSVAQTSKPGRNRRVSDGSANRCLSLRAGLQRCSRAFAVPNSAPLHSAEQLPSRTDHALHVRYDPSSQEWRGISPTSSWFSDNREFSSSDKPQNSSDLPPRGRSETATP
jgi:hypothetical protein